MNCEGSFIINDAELDRLYAGDDYEAYMERAMVLATRHAKRMFRKVAFDAIDLDIGDHESGATMGDHIVSFTISVEND